MRPLQGIPDTCASFPKEPLLGPQPPPPTPGRPRPQELPPAPKPTASSSSTKGWIRPAEPPSRTRHKTF